MEKVRYIRLVFDYGAVFIYQKRISYTGGIKKWKLAWSSVRLAFHEACKREDRFFSRPKEIADVRGISYSYSLLWYFGVIQVPEEVKKKWM